MNVQAIQDEIDITIALFHDLPENEKTNKAVRVINAYLKKLNKQLKGDHRFGCCRRCSLDTIQHELDEELVSDMWMELASHHTNDFALRHDDFLLPLITKTIADHKKEFIDEWAMGISDEDFISYGRVQVGYARYTRAMFKKDLLRNLCVPDVENGMILDAYSSYQCAVEEGDIIDGEYEDE